jgi:CRP-like cAMP-binding protein
VQPIDTTDLAHVPLFETLDAGDLERLSAKLVLRRYPRASRIFFTGDEGTTLCIVRRGRVKLALTSPEGREVILDLFGPGDVFGELALLDGQPRSADAVAIEATQLLHLSREDFLRYLEDHPRVAIRLLGVLSRRLRRDATLVSDAAFLDVPARLARAILRLADTRADGTVGTPTLNQETLAGLAGTTRETLNKWLGFFQDQGAVVWENGAVTVIDAERLRRRAY